MSVTIIMLLADVVPYELENIRRYNRPKNNSSREKTEFSFYICVRPVLLCCKLIGFLPLNGLFNSKREISRNSWRSFFTFIYIPNLIWTTIYTISKCSNKMLYGVDRSEISGIVFAVNTLVSSILLMKMSLIWNKTINKIERLESQLCYVDHKKPTRTVKWITVTIVIYATVEFFMYLLYTAYSLKDVDQDGGDYCIKSIFTFVYNWFFDHIPFNCGLGILLLISNIQAVYLRNLTDILIMSATVYLSSRFTQFNKQLLREQKKSMHTGWMPWSDLQKYYTRLSQIVLLVDELINPFIFISFTSNLLFMCKQIFKIIESLQTSNGLTATDNLKLSNVNWEPVIFLAVTTSFAVIRPTLLCLMLAHHHTLTREPLNVLHTVPASVYNRKMQRFMDQVFHSKLGLTGLKFFYVTRESILSMVATLIKYELVLIQFPER